VKRHSSSPRTTEPCSLANVYDRLGDLRRATELHERLLEDSPDFALSYSNLAEDYFNQGRLSEARDVLDRARAAELEHPRQDPILRVRIAMAEGDLATVESELANVPAPLAARMRAELLSSRGQVREAEALLSSTGASPALIADLRPVFEDCRDAAAGPGAGLRLLLCGEDERAADNAAARLADPQLDDLVRTSSEAIVALGRGNPQEAIDRLRPRAEMEFPDPEVSWLYALALRRLDQPARAAETLRKITTNPGNSTSPLFPRAQVELGRALAAAGDTSGARQAYEAFFERWSDADEDLPLLLNARREYAALP